MGANLRAELWSIHAQAIQWSKPMKHMIQLLAALGILVWSAGAALAAPPIQTDGGQEYTVQRGDCLAMVAERFLGGQQYWPEILQATNRRALADSRFTMISHPDLIHAGQKLWLPAATAEAGFDQNTTGRLTVDVEYVGQWYRDTFHYSKEAPNIRHLAVVMSEAQYQENPNQPGHICSIVSFPDGDGPLQVRGDIGNTAWDLSVLHPVPYQAELKPGRYYVGGCFIAAPLSRQEAGVGDDAILYAGITGGGASSDYRLVTIQPGARQDIIIFLTDKDGWACPWVYVFNGHTFERRSEVLRNLESKTLEATQRQALGPLPVENGVIRLQIREEKPEVTYLDALYLEVGGMPVWPDAGLLAAVDQRYLVLRQGDGYELTFDVAALAGDAASVEATAVSTGYYDN
jgi:hypothetical protein